MLVLLLLVAACACAATNGQGLAQCKTAEWQVCVPLTDKRGTFFKSGRNACVRCEFLNGSIATVRPFPSLAGVNGVAIRGYPFHVLSAKKLAPVEQAKVITLALIDGKIPDVKNDTFAGFSRLSKLSLDSNRLTNVKQSWFSGLKNLLSLTLSNNNIKQIEPGSFVHLTRLHLLDLENNLLQVVDPSWFCGPKGGFTLMLRSNSINSVSPGSFQNVRLVTLDLRDNDLSDLNGEVLWGQPWLTRLDISSGVLWSAYDAIPHEMMWNLRRSAQFKRESVTMLVEVPKFLFCARHDARELSFRWMFDSSGIVAGNTDFGPVNPGRSCGDVNSSLSTISIQAPVVVLATDGSLADKLDTKTLEQCRQVWEYDGGITVPLVGNSFFRLVSLATESANSEDVAMSFFQTQDTSTHTTKESGSSTRHTTNTNIPHGNTKNISCILVTKDEHTKLFFTVPSLHHQTHTTQTTYRTGTDHSSSPTHHCGTTEKEYTSLGPVDQSTPQVSTTPVPDLEVVQSPGHVLIPVVVSAVVLLVVLSLAVIWKVCAARLKGENERASASDDAHVWTIPPGVTFPGLLRSASLPARSGKMASDDAVSRRSLPAVLCSIEPTYSEIPDDATYSQIPDHLAAAQRPLPALPLTCWETPDHMTAAQHPLPVLPHTYSEIPDDGDSGPMAFYAATGEISLHVVTNRRQNRRSERSIATYGSTGQTGGQGRRNLFYRRASEVECIRARRQLRTAPVSQPADQAVRTYVNVTDAILSGGHDVTRAHVTFLTQPGPYRSWEIQGEGNCFAPRRVSLPTVTLPNTYWPWEITGEGTNNTPKRASLPTVTPPNTYWPWEIPGEGTRNTPRRVSLPTVTLPNTYWPWEIPGEGPRNTPRRAPLPTATLPNTYWPWEIPGEGLSNTA
ncbi:hypothetical protein Bbelb_311240 [Branchiostoma belcheri]|nr:hypothetical protein Bbelb_311240 [Branchiostoma belcheri]